MYQLQAILQSTVTRFTGKPGFKVRGGSYQLVQINAQTLTHYSDLWSWCDSKNDGLESGQIDESLEIFFLLVNINRRHTHPTASRAVYRGSWVWPNRKVRRFFLHSPSSSLWELTEKQHKLSLRPFLFPVAVLRHLRKHSTHGRWPCVCFF